MIPMKVLMNIEEPGSEIWAKGEAHLRLCPEDLGNISAVGMLKNGTESGQPVVIVRIDLPDGSFVLGQTTFRLMHTALQAFRARYEEFL